MTLNQKSALTLSRPLLSFVALVALSACSAKVSSPNPDFNTSQPIVESGNPTVAKTVLEGKWTLSCHALSAQAYGTGEIDFSGNQYSSSMALYSDAHCSTVVVPAQTVTGTFSIPAAGQINMVQSDGSSTFNIYEITNGVLYTGLQPGTDATSRPQSADHDLPFTFAGAPQGITPQPTPAPSASSGPFTAPTQCPNLSGRYQMNTDMFTLTQVGCTQLTWFSPGNPIFGTEDQTTIYNANDVEQAVQVATPDDPSLKDQQKSHFESNRFVVEDYLTDSSGSVQQLTAYSLVAVPCNLYNPDAGVTYLMAQTYINGQLDSSRCKFWAPLIQ